MTLLTKLGNEIKFLGNLRNILGLMFIIFVCLCVAVIGAALTATSVTSWYTHINKPSWTPPNWLFGPVWTTLYLMMAIAAWLVWQQNKASREIALKLFGIQLFLNLIWSGLFFTLQNPEIAFFEITVLWLAILATLVAFLRIKLVAGLLLVPYLLWVSYATALNFAIWRLNL